MEILPGEKFGMVALPSAPLSKDLPPLLELGDGFWVSQKPFLPASEFWRETLGSFRMDVLEKSKLFLLAKESNSNPEAIDANNLRLQDAVNRLYWGLLISDWANFRDTGFILHGAHTGDRVGARSIGDLDRLPINEGIPVTPITVSRLKEAALLAGAAADIVKQPRPQFVRFWRVMNAFWDGLRDVEVGKRIHQFVRCVEGFILPETGKTEKRFKSRTETFVGPRHHELVSVLFEIRSGVEHLHRAYPADMLDYGAGEKEVLLTLIRLSAQAEALARHCVRRLLLERSLWPHFQTDDALSTFWNLPSADREKLWGTKLDIDLPARQFDPRWVKV